MPSVAAKLPSRSKLEITIKVSEEYIRADDLARLVWATNVLYELLASIFIFDSKPFADGKLQSLPEDSVLRIAKMWSGSDAGFSFLGVDKVLGQLGKGIGEIRDWREKKKQLRERTEQEHEKTTQMRLENLARAMDIYDKLKNMAPGDRERFLEMMRATVSEIEQNRNELLPM